MLSLTKKGADQPEGDPLWHSDFRNVEKLPDTKVVRTTFFINTAAIAITLGLLLWTGYREFHLKTLGDQIDEAQGLVDSNRKLSNEAERQSKLFKVEEAKLLEAEKFQRTPITTSAYVKLLGDTLPREISIEYVEIRLSETRNQLCMLRGLVAGTRDQASGSASSYVDLLRANPQLSAVFETISLDKLNPDGASGLLVFEISMKVKPEGKK